MGEDKAHAHLVNVKFNEFGFVVGYVCPNCGSQVKESHVDDIGTRFFRCEKCCQISARLKNVEKEQFLQPFKEAAQLLKDPKLLQLVKEDMGRSIKGEDENKLLIWLLELSARTKDYTFVDIVGESAVGKTALTRETLRYVPQDWWRKVGRMTRTAIDYLKDQNFYLLWIQEARGSGEAAPSIRLQSVDDGGLTVWVTERDKETGKFTTNEYSVNGRGLITTTTDVNFSPEDATRTWTISADPGEEQTRRIVGLKLERAKEPLDLLEALGKKTQDLTPIVQNAVQMLDWEIGCVIPYADDLAGLFSTKLVRTRRDVDKFLGLVKVLARLHQFQRPILEVNCKRFVVATAQDALIAFRLGSIPLEETLTGLEKRLREVYQAVTELVKQGVPATNTSVGVKIKKSSEWARKCLQALVRMGHIDVDDSQKVHVYSLREKDSNDVQQIQKRTFSAVELQNKVISFCDAMSSQTTAVRDETNGAWKRGYFEPLAEKWVDFDSSSPSAVGCEVENPKDTNPGVADSLRKPENIKAVLTLKPPYQGLCVFCGQRRTLTWQVHYFSDEFADACPDCGTPLLEKVKAQSG